MRKTIGTIGLVCVLGLLLGGPPVAAQTTLAFGNPGEPVELDPAVLVDTISSRITTQILEGLVKYKGATTEVIPALAEKWQVSSDGTVWTFTLRKNVKFHDGTSFDASAVVWNFDRWRLSAHPQHENKVKAGKTFEHFESQFGGFDDKCVIAKVEAVNPLTVRVTLRAPQGRS
jgi:peptide/nickel transport system substrate-binding protein